MKAVAWLGSKKPKCSMKIRLGQSEADSPIYIIDIILYNFPSLTFVNFILQFESLLYYFIHFYPIEGKKPWGFISFSSYCLSTIQKKSKPFQSFFVVFSPHCSRFTPLRIITKKVYINFQLESCVWTTAELASLSFLCRNLQVSK